MPYFHGETTMVGYICTRVGADSNFAKFGLVNRDIIVELRDGEKVAKLDTPENGRAIIEDLETLNPKGKTLLVQRGTATIELKR